MPIPDHIEILEPWEVLTDSRSRSLASRVKEQLPQKHVLSELSINALAKRRDTDDVLLEVSGGSEPLAVVHMTWKKESDPRWPRTEFFASWQHWATEAMVRDHRITTGEE